MGKYKKYKNRMEMYLSSENGKRTLSFCYSWGASIVIIGALFKLLHLPYANEILTIAMITEALVFFISAFERPGSEYNWEEVFPVLKSKNPMDRPDFDRAKSDGSSHGGPIIVGDISALSGSGIRHEGGPIYVGGMQQQSAHGAPVAHTSAPTGTPMAGVTPQESAAIGLTAMGLNVTEEDSRKLADSIQKLGEAAEQISKMADLTDATQTYITQITSVTDNLERFNTITDSLGEVSDTLINSCKVIAGSSSEETEVQAVGYVKQMEQLNQNLSGINQFYEVHLTGLRSQMDTIHHINDGLNRIRSMYDSSVMDSTAFRNENERMAQLLNQLNQVYSRLLQAMTVNMQAGGGMPYQGQPQQQPPYQGQGYPQQPPYPNR